MKIDTSGWKEFKLNELFKISGSKTTPKKRIRKVRSWKLSLYHNSSGL